MKLARAALLAAIAATSVDSMAQTKVAASATASASAAPARVEIPPWPDGALDTPAFDAAPFSDETTPSPTPDEWKAAPNVRVSRVSPTVTGCSARRVREWIKFRCDTKTAGVRLLAGSADGVSLYVAEAAVPEAELKEHFDLSTRYFETIGRFGEIVFPVRKGDRRAFEWLRLDVLENYDGPPGVGAATSLWIEERWPDGGKPEIAVLSR